MRRRVVGNVGGEACACGDRNVGPWLRQLGEPLLQMDALQPRVVDFDLAPAALGGLEALTLLADGLELGLLFDVAPGEAGVVDVCVEDGREWDEVLGG